MILKNINEVMLEYEKASSAIAIITVVLVITISLMFSAYYLDIARPTGRRREGMEIVCEVEVR